MQDHVMTLLKWKLQVINPPKRLLASNVCFEIVTLMNSHKSPAVSHCDLRGPHRVLYAPSGAHVAQGPSIGCDEQA